MTYSSRFAAILQNLQDAGCDDEMIRQFMACREKGNCAEQIRLLSLQRKKLLDGVHQGERRIECLDYLVYQIGKEA